MNTLCVTGANARYFITTLAFLEGLTGAFSAGAGARL